MQLRPLPCLRPATCPATLCLAALVLCVAAHGLAAPARAADDRAVDPNKAERTLRGIAPADDWRAPAATTGPLQPAVRLHYEAARQHRADGNAAEALAELNRGLQQARGDCFDLLLLLAEIKRERGQFGEARIAAEHAVAYRPRAPRAHFLLGRLHQRSEAFEQAAAHYRAVTLVADQHPDNPQVTVAWYRLGQCLEQAGYLLAAAEAYAQFDRIVWQTRPAEQEAEEIAALLAQHPHGTIERQVDLLHQVGHDEEAAAAARAALDRSPDSRYLRRLYLRTLLDAGQPAVAFETGRDWLTATPPAAETQPAEPACDTALLALTIEAAAAARQLTAWITELERAVAAGHQLAFAEQVANQLDEADAHSGAVALWQALAAARPDAPDVVWALANALHEAGDLDGALDALIAFVRAHPDAADIPASRLADWTRSFADSDALLESVQRRTQAGDADYATYAVLGVAAAAAGETDLAERLFRGALERAEELALVHIAWGRMLAGNYRWKEALEHARQALEIRENQPAALLLKAEAHAGLDQNDAAEAAYKLALQQQPDDYTYVMALAQHYRRTGNALAAQRYLQQAWSLEPTRPAAVEDLVDSYLETGKVEIARKCLEQAEVSELPANALWRLRTTLEFADEPYQEAHIAAMEARFREHPEDTRTGLKLAAALYLGHRPDEALAVLDRVARQTPDDERILHLRARLYQRALQFDQALGILRTLVERYPRRLAGLDALSEALLAAARVDEARDVLRRILELGLTDQQREAYRTELLGTYVDYMRFDEALALVDRWIEDDPANDTWPRARMHVLLVAERGHEAVDLAAMRLAPARRQYEELITKLRGSEDGDLQATAQRLQEEIEETEARLRERRADYMWVCLEADRLLQAEQEARRWHTASPDDPQYQEWLIDVLLAAEKPNEAMSMAQLYAPKTAADVLKVLGWRGRCFSLMGQVDEGVEELSKLLDESFIQATPGAASRLRQEIIRMLVEANDYTEAVRWCNRWLLDADNEPALVFELLLLKQFVLQRAEREEDYIEVSEQLLEFQPNQPGLNNDLGYTLVNRGQQVHRALEMIRIAVAAEPTNPAYLDSLGWAHYKLGQFDQARRYLERSVQQRVGQDATVYDHLGDAAYRLGDHDAALQHWSKALELLQEAELDERVSPRAKLIADIRRKLAALDSGEAAEVAPTAAEQETAP